MKTYTKNNASFWERKVVFQTPAARTYSVQIQHDKKRAYINLGTSNREEAGALALRFYQELKANGWDDTLRRRQAIRMGGKNGNVTIGQYVDAVKAKSLIHAKTIESYASRVAKDRCRHPRNHPQRQAFQLARTGGRNQTRHSYRPSDRSLAGRFHQAWIHEPAQGKERPSLGEQHHRTGPIALRRRSHLQGS